MLHTHGFIVSVLISLTKQAKTLTKPQIKLITGLIQQTRYPVRNQVIFLLSVRAGLRAKERASLTWEMVTDADGQLSSSIHLRDVASKGRSGRIIPLNKELRRVLEALKEDQNHSPHVITTVRSGKTSPATIVNLHQQRSLPSVLRRSVEPAPLCGSSGTDFCGGAVRAR